MAAAGGLFRCPNCSESVIVPGDPVDYVSDEELDQIDCQQKEEDRRLAAFTRQTDRVSRIIFAGIVAVSVVGVVLTVGWVASWTLVSIKWYLGVAVTLFFLWILLRICAAIFEILIG